MSTINVLNRKENNNKVNVLKTDKNDFKNKLDLYVCGGKNIDRNSILYMETSYWS